MDELNHPHHIISTFYPYIAYYYTKILLTPKTTLQNKKNENSIFKKTFCLQQAKSLATLGMFFVKRISHKNSNTRECLENIYLATLKQLYQKQTFPMNFVKLILYITRPISTWRKVCLYTID